MSVAAPSEGGTGTAREGKPPVRYVCMPGSPYTGSTLLGYLLNAHPACASIGAAVGLSRKVDLATYACSCGERFLDCPFWLRVEERTRSLGSPVTIFDNGFWNTHVNVSRRRWLNGVLIRSLGSEPLTALRDAAVWWFPPIRHRLQEARRSSWSLARAVLEVTGKEVFVDTARDHQRPKYLAADPRLDVRVIHLVRDPRGNTSSIVGHTGVGVAEAARQWRHYNVEADRVRRSAPPGSWLRLRYEQLCADPQGTMDLICRFVGVEPVPLPRDLQAVEHHIIGNSMRLRAVETIREDRSWQQKLSPADLRVIAGIVGPTSRRMGYDWP
ncbi:MAG: sulfotransferase [Candidatus Velamenicoccus archaeovorus]